VTRTFDARRERFGRWYEELEPGDLYRHWPGKTVTEADDHLFCLLTMQVSPIHVDAHYAREEMEWGRNIVVGTLVYCLVYGMSVPDTSGKAIANLAVDGIRHPRPVFHGDTLYGESRVLERRLSQSRPHAGVVTIETAGRNQDGEVVVEFRRTFLVPTRPAT
jgi:acyl dehydratase